VVLEPPAISRSSLKIRSGAAMAGAVETRWCRRGEVAAPVVLPAAAAHPLSDWVRVLRWGTVAAANLVS